jgi:transposase
VTNSTNETPAVTVGIDVSDRLTSFCVLDMHGEILEEGKVQTSPIGFTRRFSVMEPCRIVMEVGTHSRWASKLLAEIGHEVIVANPWKVRLIANSIRKTDRSDAEILARLGRVDPKLLSPVIHRGDEAQADLAIIHARESLIASRRLLINHIRGSVKSFGARVPTCDADVFDKKALAAIPPELRPALEPLVTVIAQLTREIRQADARIEALCSDRYPETKVLRQIQGVGSLISLAYILTIDNPFRFKASRTVGPYLGLVPRQRESGQRAPQLKISKAGDKYLRKLLVNGAHYILGYRGPDTDLRRWGLSHSVGGKAAKKRAVVGVARRLAVLLHRLWVTGEVYVPLRCVEVAA